MVWLLIPAQLHAARIYADDKYDPGCNFPQARVSLVRNRD